MRGSEVNARELLSEIRAAERVLEASMAYGIADEAMGDAFEAVRDAGLSAIRMVRHSLSGFLALGERLERAEEQNAGLRQELSAALQKLRSLDDQGEEWRREAGE